VVDSEQNSRFGSDETLPLLIESSFSGERLQLWPCRYPIEGRPERGASTV
jgi:hypothetical protein